MPNHDELLEILLNNRGIKREDWDSFLNPSYDLHLYDPYLLKDMELAVLRIYEAVEAKEKIVIYSDYDADGIPSAVIMSDFFKKIGFDNFVVYIPDRHDEGYGLHMEAIKEFIKNGVSLLITFDLGITAIDEVVEAKANDIDIIIVDHHLPIKDNEGKDVLPKAYAVVDPKRTDCNYKDEMLCGAGLAYKLIQALVFKYGEYWKINKGWEKWLLDMAGIATLADQVPLLNENRIIAYYGLKVLRKSKRPGLFELFKKNGIEMKNIAEEDITFTLAPRINVASRMDNPMLAFNLLSENDSSRAKNIVDILEKINNERKISVASIMKEVKHKITKKYKDEDLDNVSFFVLGDPKWHIGVLGIVASKIVDEYKKSVFVWGGNDGEIRGSCRGYGDVNLVKIMSLLPEGSLLNFGGHKSAGGFSVNREEIHFLEERLGNVFTLETDQKINERLIDAEISIDDVNLDNYKVIEKLAPYGEGNPKPVFKLKNLVVDYIKEFGKEKNHLELGFKNSKGKIIKAISFFKTRNDFNNLKEGENIDMISTFEKSNFLGREELRLRIVDIL
ncbi:MAG: single-stranded-DNA-specific exonuclease [Parcubacteria bacterium RAAC4_OD1_1]|nr:MAG: single-stranded-DNA-specific exonuclease [Parcubacteria bacterium RAAC4_OD1_1]